MRICNHCKKPKEESEFNTNSSKKNGKQTWCRECTTEYNRQWYELNQEDHRTYVREHDKRVRKVHLCKICGKGEPEVEFYIKKTGNRLYRRFLCRDCDAEYKKKYPASDALKARGNEVRSETRKMHRTDKANRAYHILTDSKLSDRKRCMENDLDEEYIKTAISFDCSYCGQAEEMMTLDRIDNSIGHLKANVVPCCMQCNYFRRNMPFEAWLLLVPAMKEARRRGLLDGWHCGTGSSRKKDIASVAQEDEQRSFKPQDVASSAPACTSLAL